MPYFENEEADRVAKIHACTYSPSKDAYEFQQDNVDEVFEGLMIETEDGARKVYSIGGGTWVWDKADDPSEKVEDANGDDIPEGCVLIAVEDVECGFTDGGRTPNVAHKKGEMVIAEDVFWDESAQSGMVVIDGQDFQSFLFVKNREDQ